MDKVEITPDMDESDLFRLTGSLGVVEDIIRHGITEIRRLGSGYAVEGDVNSRCTFFALFKDGLEFRVATTNGDPVWEEENAQAFGELAEACGVELR